MRMLSISILNTISLTYLRICNEWITIRNVEITFPFELWTCNKLFIPTTFTKYTNIYLNQTSVAFRFLPFRLVGKISKYRYVNSSYYYKFMLRCCELYPRGWKGGRKRDADSTKTTTINANTHISVMRWWNQIVFNLNKFE